MMAWSHVMSGIMGLCINFSTDGYTFKLLLYKFLFSLDVSYLWSAYGNIYWSLFINSLYIRRSCIARNACSSDELIDVLGRYCIISWSTCWRNDLWLFKKVKLKIYQMYLTNNFSSYNLVFYVGGLITLIVGVIPLIVSVNIKRIWNKTK